MPIDELEGESGRVSGFKGYKIVVGIRVCWYKVGLKLSLS